MPVLDQVSFARLADRAECITDAPSLQLGSVELAREPVLPGCALNTRNAGA